MNFYKKTPYSVPKSKAFTIGAIIIKLKRFSYFQKKKHQ